MKVKKQNPKEIFKAFLSALQTGDTKAAEGLLSERAAQVIKNVSVNQNKSVDDVLNQFLKFSASDQLPDIEKEIIKGKMAFVVVKNQITDESDCYVFQKENDNWKFEIDYDAVAIETSLIGKLIEYLRNAWSSLVGVGKAKT